MQGYKISHNIQISNLKLMRIKKGLTQAELSIASGVPLKCIGNYEQLRRNINHARVDIVYRLSTALNCQMEEILEIGELS